MPDSTTNFSIDTANAPVGSTTVSRTEFINVLEHLNYSNGNIRSIDNLSGSAGLLQVDGSGGATVKSLAANDGFAWTNADGAGGNPTLSVGDPVEVAQAINATESNTLTASKNVSLISVAGTYDLPEPTSGVVSNKVVVNSSSSSVTVTSSHWANSTITTSVVIAGKSMAIFFSDSDGRWYVQHSDDLTIT